MTRPTTIYLVRHAESRPSAEVREPDWPLSERGREQARALVAAMQGLGIDAIYSGDRDFALPDGESNRACARRMVQAIDALAARHPGETIALASHGNALALYLGSLDPSFGYAQWRAMRNPDLFRVVYEAGRASWDGASLPTCDETSSTTSLPPGNSR